MSFYNDFIAEIEKTIVSMSHEQKCLFILLTCDKMLPNYVSFSEKNDWGNSRVLKNEILMLEKAILEIPIATTELSELNKFIEANIPDLDSFETGSFAFDTSIVFSEAIEYLINKDTKHILNIAQGILDTIDMFVQIKEDLDPNDIELDNKIQKSEYIKREFKRQRLLVNHIKNTEIITKEVIAEIRQLNDSFGAVIDIELLGL
jgi:uncharacterized protein YjaG (DUF416 family)